MNALLRLLIPTSLLLVGCSSPTQAQEPDVAKAIPPSKTAMDLDRLPEDTFTLTDSATAPNAGWCWYEDERAIIDTSNPENPLLLISTVSAAPRGDAEWGDIDLLWRRLGSGEQGDFELHDQLERDDHDSASLYLRPDGKYLAMYSMHGTDHETRWRVSTNPHDPTAWDAEQTYTNSGGTTYNNSFHLADDDGGKGRTYNFTRSGDRDPYVQVSSDHGNTWENAGRLLQEFWPYLRYASNGKRVHFISTENHPRFFQNGIYHGFVKDGKLFDSFGKIADANIFDAESVKPQSLTPVFKNGTAFHGTDMFRAWTIDVVVADDGQPVVIFSARANDSREDHRFFYARFDGAIWTVHEMAKAGGFLYEGESDYTGLVAIDPDNINVVYMSTEIDPRNGKPTEKYELYRGRTKDGGATWSWAALTERSSVDNLRPIVPKWNKKQTALLWQRGTYFSYLNWDTEAVGCVFEGEALND